MKNYHEVPNISIEKALEIVRVAIEIGEEKNIKVSVSVVDRSMNLIAFAKADGASPHSTETSRKKANASASTGKSTGWMSPEILFNRKVAWKRKGITFGEHALRCGQRAPSPEELPHLRQTTSYSSDWGILGRTSHQMLNILRFQ